ncbi:hypothetical protein QM787_20975 [Rhodococcus ruber]|uniref:Uncharacterized protein n=1 Tax=Rhodococcus ruber TaxID=1830 RepID=A0A098BGP4_9NOCA|nr:hypothetical protein [Rhodococcus ruber]MCD2128944.1 hypothetical protein [Rhodococcus ruber]MCZ4504814.1 hypothetical protein [Rhodococcus ruber]MCZ4532522.1 hypothetical protein [Rhodococcus ruber]MCZ4623063.1 hypothetical protein [Rhodococcus ruber]MDI9969774.1 hypothetical protein [Rhodococcus ruber]
MNRSTGEHPTKERNEQIPDVLAPARPGLVATLTADPARRSLWVHRHRCRPTTYAGTRCVLIPEIFLRTGVPLS